MTLAARLVSEKTYFAEPFPQVPKTSCKGHRAQRPQVLGPSRQGILQPDGNHRGAPRRSDSFTQTARDSCGIGPRLNGLS